jgi:DNA-binding transcriptional MerR regulator
MLTPSQVAKRANVSGQTIRNYSSEYAELLSPTASVKNGTRLYTDEDVQILCAIAELRKAGIPPGEIVARLQSDIPTIVDVDSNEPIKDPQEPLETVQEALLAPQMLLPTLNARFEAIERQIEAQERRQHDRWTIIALSFIAGMVAALVLFGVAYLLLTVGR